MYICKICFEEKENREEVICPCKCSGSMKYTCIGCMNQLLEHNKENSNYTICTVCKTEYKRDVGNYYYTVNSELLVNSLFCIFSASFLFFIIIYLCRKSETFTSLIFLLIIIMFLAIILVSGVNITIYVIYFCFIFSDIFNKKNNDDFLNNHEARSFFELIFVTVFLSIFFIIFCCNVVTVDWDNNFKKLMNSYISMKKSKMYDYDINTYIQGII